MASCMQRLLSDLSNISFGALRVSGPPICPKEEINGGDVGWELSLSDKIQEYAVMLAKFKICPFLNTVA